MADNLLSGVLTDEHCQCINRCLESIPKTQAIIDALKQCEMDCSSADEMNKLQLAKATKLKALFFPNNP